MLAQFLLVASAAIVLALGCIHLVYTFFGRRLTPRDPSLQSAMAEVPLVLTRQTTMWKAWVGFNASHSMGAILFGLVYGYLALAHGELLLHSWFLPLVGFAMLSGLLVLARLYWFRAPFRSLCVSLLCYAGGLALLRS
ncbi:MAG TPA: hypothetical protein VFJ70_11930 [Burkholderiales bacterium]|nr:hypothetical protein [Burkholderiales bacterium]